MTPSGRGAIAAWLILIAGCGYWLTQRLVLTTDMSAFLQELKSDTERNGHRSSVAFHGHPIVTVRPHAFKRCLGNLV